MGKKGLLILIGAAFFIAGLSVQVGLYHDIKSINAATTGERMDLRDYYETLSAPDKLIMVVGFPAVPMGFALIVAGLVMSKGKK